MTPDRTVAQAIGASTSECHIESGDRVGLDIEHGAQYHQCTEQRWTMDFVNDHPPETIDISDLRLLHYPGRGGELVRYGGVSDAMVDETAPSPVAVTRYLPLNRPVVVRLALGLTLSTLLIYAAGILTGVGIAWRTVLSNASTDGSVVALNRVCRNVARPRTGASSNCHPRSSPARPARRYKRAGDEQRSGTLRRINPLLWPNRRPDTRWKNRPTSPPRKRRFPPPWTPNFNGTTRTRPRPCRRPRCRPGRRSP